MDRFDWLELPSAAPAPERVWERESFDAEAYLQRAERDYRRGGYETALAVYAKALREDGERPEAWLGQVNCLVEMGELDEARIWANKALERFPDDAELLSGKALALAKLGEGEGAMLLVDRAVAKKTPTPYVWLARGLVLLAVNPEQHSRTCFLKAQEGAPNDGFVDLRIALGYLEQREFPRAKEFLLRAVERDSENPLGWYSFGSCCEGLFAYARARSCYERSLSAGPELKDRALEALGRLANRGIVDKVGAFFRRLGGD